jgi:hypothetical protein
VLRETTSRGRCELVCPSLSHFLHTGPVRPICVIWPIFLCVFSCVCLLLRYLSQMFSLFLCNRHSFNRVSSLGTAFAVTVNLFIYSHGLSLCILACLCPFVKRFVSWTNFSRGALIKYTGKGKKFRGPKSEISVIILPLFFTSPSLSHVCLYQVACISAFIVVVCVCV